MDSFGGFLSPGVGLPVTMQTLAVISRDNQHAGVAFGPSFSGAKRRSKEARCVAVRKMVGKLSQGDHQRRSDVIVLGSQRPFAGQYPAKNRVQKSDSEGQFDPAPTSLRHTIITHPLANGDTRADAQAFGPARLLPTRHARVW